MEGEELSNLTDKMTRAAVFPIYPVPRAAPATMQAVRVIVWQAPEGVRVAPVGTPVAAPAVEALLVALDPKADLAAWLSRR